MLLASDLSLDFWGYALSAAVYLYNRTPTSALNGKTPYESYHGTPPSLDHLRPWGCSAWLSLPREGSYRTTKLDARAVEARFVGYPPDRKGWLFWVPEWRSVVAWWEVERWEETRMGHGGERGRDLEDLGGFEDVFGEDGGAQEAGELLEGEQGMALGGVPQAEADGSDSGADDVEVVPDTSADTSGLSGAQPSAPAQALPSPPSPPPPPPPAALPPAPDPILPPAPRRSGRLAGDAPSHFVPIDGAPEASSIPSRTPSPTASPLSLATLDVDLDRDDSAIVAASFDGDAPLSRATIEHALATSPAWTGSLDQPTFNQAMSGPDADKWLAACEVELSAFDATGTWERDLVELPAGRKSIAVKWVLLIKRDTEGRVIKYKARLVARGDMQVDGIDYDETHSSTVRLTTVRLVFALLSAHPHWRWAQFDISNAYLLGHLTNEIYIRQPPGFIDPDRPKVVRRLKKALYGLRQGGREWQKVLRGALEGMGFKCVESDHGLYVRRRGDRVLIVPTHVDDGTVDLDQRHYAQSVLDRFFPQGLSPVTTPLDSSYADVAAATEEERHHCPYRELLGALIYLSACTRPDLAFALSLASRFASCPARRHWSLLTHVCRYLTGTTHLGLRYVPPSTPFSSDLLTAWSDADHGADKDTHRSVSGYVFGFGDDSLRSTAVSWLSRRQKSVSTSTVQAEYVALSEASREALWLRQVLRELGYPTPRPTLIRGDNAGSLVLASHPTSHSRTKHIAIHYHFTRSWLTTGPSSSSGYRLPTWSLTFSRRASLR
ncbi:hypothetical protein JCM5296_003862 [Sporobolomyces johnsonii]